MVRHKEPKLTLLEAVTEVTLQALGFDPDERIFPEDALVIDLGMESLDKLDLRFRLEQRLAMQFKDFTSEFDAGRIVTFRDLVNYVDARYKGTYAPNFRKFEGPDYSKPENWEPTIRLSAD